MDPRHKLRIKIIQNLYAQSFSKGKKNLPYPAEPKTSKIIKKLSLINQLIKENAPRFPIDKITKIDLAILQLAIYELFVKQNEPKKVIINEAVELAKTMGGERSFSFVNGVLGKIVLTNTKIYEK